MDISAVSIEDTLDAAASTAPQITLCLQGYLLTAVRLAAWNRETGILVCRGGHGFTEEDIHYVRAASIQALTIRVPAPRQESDRLGAEIRDALRHAAGYPIRLLIRPDAFIDAPAPLAAWCKNIVEAIAQLEPQREALQAAVDQILLREGGAVAVLGGSTLILEAAPNAIPTPAAIRDAIAPRL